MCNLHQVKFVIIMKATDLGDVAALVRSQMNGLLLFESTIEKNNRNNVPSPKIITAATMIKQ